MDDNFTLHRPMSVPDLILTELEEAPERTFTVKQLARLVGATAREAAKSCSRLCAEGEIKRVARGVYAALGA